MFVICCTQPGKNAASVVEVKKLFKDINYNGLIDVILSKFSADITLQQFKLFLKYLVISIDKERLPIDLNTIRRELQINCFPAESFVGKVAQEIASTILSERQMEAQKMEARIQMLAQRRDAR